MNKQMAEKMAAITGKSVSEYFDEKDNEAEFGRTNSVETTSILVPISSGSDEHDGSQQDTAEDEVITEKYTSPKISRGSKIKNKNKSKYGELHKCDHCGASPDEVWSGNGIDGQYCFEHFRELHEDVEEFDEWCKRFDV